MQSVSDALWSTPFCDAEQPGKEYTGPVGRLSQSASSVFPFVFEQRSERTPRAQRPDLSGATSEAVFGSASGRDTLNGELNG